MFILLRKISPYTNEDIILGIFEDANLAQNATKSYINHCLVTDIWASQAYVTVNLQEDVIVVDAKPLLKLDSKTKNLDLFVVSQYFEGFGQIEREIKLIFNDVLKVKNYIDTTDEDIESVNYYDYETIELNKLYLEK